LRFCSRFRFCFRFHFSSMAPAPASIVWRRYRRRFRVPLRTGAGVFHEREGILVRVKFPGGAGSGAGEIAPWPGFGCETLGDAETFLRDYRGGAVPRELPCVCAAVEMAWNSLCSPFSPAVLRSAALLAGGREAGAGSLRSLESLAALLEARRAAGFSTFKLKITGEPDSPSLHIARTLLHSLKENERLRLDANGSLPALAPWLPLLEDPRLEFLEQPFSPARMDAERTAPAPAEISLRFVRKLALDESVSCAAPLPENWPGFVVIKPAFLMDWDLFREWRRRHPETPVIYSSAFETSVGREALLRLAAEDPAASDYAHGLDMP
jgi:O-succinylbenzoate synthase